MTDEELFSLVARTKKAIIRYVDHGEQAAQPFHLSVMMLEVFEKELKARGFDPSDEAFGVDIIGKIIEMRLEDASA